MIKNGAHSDDDDDDLFHWITAWTEYCVLLLLLPLFFFIHTHFLMEKKK